MFIFGLKKLSVTIKLSLLLKTDIKVWSIKPDVYCPLLKFTFLKLEYIFQLLAWQNVYGQNFTNSKKI